MPREAVVWGVHMGRHVNNRPIEDGYVAIGWAELGDIRKISSDRETIKTAILAHDPKFSAGALPVHAGQIYRFAREMKEGDYVVYPSKHDRMINIGRFTGKTDYVEGDADEYPNRREVKWLKHCPRSEFSQSALNEIGSALTLFRVKTHAGEFLSKIGVEQISVPAPVVEVAEDRADDDAATVSVSQQAEESTADFVIRRVMSELSGYQFEELVAHLLECMGYTARVTTRSGDGGVDVIAHTDVLGFQPPIIKVQCKRQTGQTGNAEVNQLLGTLGEGEFGLFVNLGSYTRSAIELERNRPKLRLINGEGFVDLVLQHYAKLAPRYRSLIPLKQIYVPDLPKA